MSIIISIFQAILQAISYIIPISEAGHSAVYHDLAGKADGTVSALTGVIHIGIALGIFAAMIKICLRMGKEVGRCAADLIHKEFSLKTASPARKFLLFLMLCFAPMLLWLIPVNHNFLYEFLRSFAFNNTLLDEGLLFAVTGALLVFASKQLTLGRNRKPVTLPAVLFVSVLALALVPLPGLSLVGGVFASLILFGTSKKQAFNFTMLMTIPVLLGSGIAEIVTAAKGVGAVAAVIGIVLAAVFAFLCTRVLKFVINKGYLKYIAYYDLFIGLIVAVIGIVQLIVR